MTPRSAAPGLQDASWRAAEQTLIRVLAYSGLRWGEASALRVHAVDLDRRRLEVDQAHTEVGGKIVVGPQRTTNAARSPIPRFLAEELRAHLAGKGPNELVFTSPKGGALRNTNFRPRFLIPAAERVGLSGLTPHELRHTAASLAIKAGANVKVLQQMLGHASAAMTLDVYAGLFADNLDEVADRLDQAFEGLRADQLRTIGRTSGVASLDYRSKSTADQGK